MERVEVVVIGAGPAGLAAGGALAAHGVRARLLERDRVASAWHHHYERLHLHTIRSLSGLPGRPIPRRSGRYVARADVVRYLDDYRSALDLDVREGVEVERVERAGNVYRVVTADGALEAGAVVVATGYNRTPLLPEWPGAETFAGEIIHSAAYRDGSPFAGRDVLVAGCGNSGAEIACDLVEHGARSVRVSIRTPPHIVPRQALGLPAQVVGIGLKRLPAAIGDAVTAASRACSSATCRGTDSPGRRMAWSRATAAATRCRCSTSASRRPSSRAGSRSCRRSPRLPRRRSCSTAAERIRVDAIVAATGYRRDLEQLVGHLEGVLDDAGVPRALGGATAPGLPRLHFTGYANDLGGNLRAIDREAEEIAAAVLERRGLSPKDAAMEKSGTRTRTSRHRSSSRSGSPSSATGAARRSRACASSSRRPTRTSSRNGSGWARRSGRTTASSAPASRTRAS